jgi:hypothetical protein
MTKPQQWMCLLMKQVYSDSNKDPEYKPEEENSSNTD